MTQSIPLTISFTEGATVYGDYWASYLRIVPWGSAQTIASYPAGASLCSLNLGYLATHLGVAFTNHDTLVADSIGCTVWTDSEMLGGTARASFRLATVSGAATEDTARAFGACVRVQGGSRTDTIDVERHDNVSGYFLLWLNTIALGMTWVLVRVNAGAVTVLATEAVPGSSLAYLTTDRVAELTVRNVVGSPVLTAKTGVTTATTTIFGGSITDSSGSKITTAGRFGFLGGRDRQEAGSTNTAIVCMYWELLDAGANTILRDEWVRNPGQLASGVNFQATYTDANAIAGRAAQCMHMGDIFGNKVSGGFPASTQPFRRRTFARNTGNNRIFTGMSGDPGGGVPAHVASFGAQPLGYVNTSGQQALIQLFKRPCNLSFRRKITTTWHWTHTPGTYTTPTQFSSFPPELVNVGFGSAFTSAGPGNDLPGFVLQYGKVVSGSYSEWRIVSQTGRNSASSLRAAPFNLSTPTDLPDDWGDEVGNPPTPIIIECDFQVIGTTPTRQMVLVIYVNGTAVPLPSGSGSTGWTLDGDGFTQRGSESVMGTPTFNTQSNQARYEWVEVQSSTIAQVYVTFDEWTDVLTVDSCGVTSNLLPAPFAYSPPTIAVALTALPTTLTLLPAAFAYSPPPFVVALANNTVSALKPAAFAYSPPLVRLSFEELARTPQGQVKFGGPVAGTVRYGGPLAGKIGS